MRPYTNDRTVNPTQKGTEMFMILIRTTFPGLYQNILNFYKALSSKNEWLLLFFDDLVIFSNFKVSRVDPANEFPCTAVPAGSLTGVSKQQLLVSCYPENVGTNPIRGDQGLQLWASAAVHKSQTQQTDFICHLSRHGVHYVT